MKIENGPCWPEATVLIRAIVSNRGEGEEGAMITWGWAPLFRWTFISRPNTFSLFFFFPSLKDRCLSFFVVKCKHVWNFWSCKLIFFYEKESFLKSKKILVSYLKHGNFFLKLELMNWEEGLILRRFILRDWIELIKNKQFFIFGFQSSPFSK